MVTLGIHFLSETQAEWMQNLEGAEAGGPCGIETAKESENRGKLIKDYHKIIQAKKQTGRALNPCG